MNALLYLGKVQRLRCSVQHLLCTKSLHLLFSVSLGFIPSISVPLSGSKNRRLAPFSLAHLRQNEANACSNKNYNSCLKSMTLNTIKCIEAIYFNITQHTEVRKSSLTQLLAWNTWQNFLPCTKINWTRRLKTDSQHNAGHRKCTNCPKSYLPHSRWTSRPPFTFCTNPMSLTDKICVHELWPLLPTRKIQSRNKTLLCWLWLPLQSSDRPTAAGAPLPTTESMCDRALCTTPWLAGTSGWTHVSASKKNKWEKCVTWHFHCCVYTYVFVCSKPTNVGERIGEQTPVKDD